MSTTDDIVDLDTQTCNYFVITQPTLVAIQAGDQIEATLWHLLLFSNPPSEGHVVMTLDGDIVFELTIPIPAPIQTYYPTWTAPRDYPAGARVVVHLHNHGNNTWRFLPMICKPAE